MLYYIYITLCILQELEKIQDQIAGKKQIDGIGLLDIPESPRRKGTDSNGTSGDEFVADDSKFKEHLELNRVLSTNNEILHSKLAETVTQTKQDADTIDRQMEIITQLTNELKVYEQTVKELNEKLNSESVNVNELKQELASKEKQIQNTKKGRSDSISHLTVRIKQSSMRSDKKIGSPHSQDSGDRLWHNVCCCCFLFCFVLFCFFVSKCFFL